MKLLIDLFLLRETPYRYAAENPRSPLWMPFLLIGTGAVYGILVAIFQRILGGNLQGFAVQDISNPILMGGNILSGIFVALIFHGGVTMVIWLMARGVGGAGRLAVLYRSTAFILPLAVPAFPYMAAHSVPAESQASLILPLGWSYPLLAAIALVMVIVGLFRLFRVTQKLSTFRCGFAVFLVFFFSLAVYFLQ
ncbi:MAG TPA: hypothetical protein ENN66_00195 [Proteobacteria bacterium]|nr:hypothetical protein [Pseudomonadota bacterium]